MIIQIVNSNDKSRLSRGYQHNGQNRNSDFHACIEVNSDTQSEFDSVSAKYANLLIIFRETVANHKIDMYNSTSKDYNSK